jgi:hypothetical protein
MCLFLISSETGWPALLSSVCASRKPNRPRSIKDSAHLIPLSFLFLALEHLVRLRTARFSFRPCSSKLLGLVQHSCLAPASTFGLARPDLRATQSISPASSSYKKATPRTLPPARNPRPASCPTHAPSSAASHPSPPCTAASCPLRPVAAPPVAVVHHHQSAAVALLQPQHPAPPEAPSALCFLSP